MIFLDIEMFLWAVVTGFALRLWIRDLLRKRNKDDTGDFVGGDWR